MKKIVSFTNTHIFRLMRRKLTAEIMALDVSDALEVDMKDAESARVTSYTIAKRTGRKFQRKKHEGKFYIWREE